MTNNKDKWLRALQAKGIRTPQDEVGRAGRHRQTTRRLTRRKIGPVFAR